MAARKKAEQPRVSVFTPSEPVVLSENAKKVRDMTASLVKKSLSLEPMKKNLRGLPCVSTGALAIDWLIGGSPAKDGKGLICPGFPRRKFVEVFGKESCGKTTLALSSVAGVQKMGGVAMYLDFEHALEHGYAQALGVDMDNLLVYQPNTLEEGFKLMSIGLATGVDLIIVDSVAAMIPQAELDKDVGAQAKIGNIAKPMSEQLPKFAQWLDKFPLDQKTKQRDPTKEGTSIVLLNQTRASISTGGWGAKESEDASTKTTGGNALKFYAHVRIQMIPIGKEYLERADPLTGKKVKRPYGNKTLVKIIKSRVDGKQGHDAQIFIRYGYGIDNYLSLIETGTAKGILKREGAWYTYGDQRYNGRDAIRQFLAQTPQEFETLKKEVLERILLSAQAVSEEEELSEEDLILSELEDNEDEAHEEEEIVIPE